MKYVGGYQSLLLLEEDAMAFDLVLVAMEAEAQAHEIVRRQHEQR